MLTFLKRKLQEKKTSYTLQNKAYIAFGAAIIAAAFEGVDATPMEGFSPEKVDEILG